MPDSMCDVIQFLTVVPDTTRDTTLSASGDSICDEASEVRVLRVDKSTAHANFQHPQMQRLTIGQERQIRIGFLHIRSVAKKTNDVRELFQTHHLDVLAWNET